jgi:hypothetical protein
MESIVNIEKTFQQLLEQLQSKSSHRITLDNVVRFVDILLKKQHPALFESYYQQLIPHIFDICHHESLKYHPPEFYQSLSAFVSKAGNGMLAGGEEIRVQQLSVLIRLHHTLTCICLGEPLSALSLWHPEWVREHKRILTEQLREINDIQVLQRFRAWTAYLNKLHFPSPGLFTELESVWEFFLEKPARNTVWIPLVEENLFNHKNYQPVTTLEPLSLEASRLPSEYNRDFIHFNYNVDPGNDMMYQQAYDALYATRKILKTPLSLIDNEYIHYKLNFSFTQKNFFYRGDSLGLGMVLLNMCELSHVGNHHDIFSINEPLVVTGIVDNHGQVRPIAPESLSHKINTFYYSPFQHLLIPEENLSDAKKDLDMLQRKYPHKKVTLHSAGRIHSLIHNTALLRKRKRQLSLLNKLKIVSRIAWPVLAIIFAFLSAYLFFTDRDRNPVSFKANGEHLLAYNSSGRLLWKYEFPFDVEPLLIPTRRSEYNYYAFGDIDGDEHNEVIISVNDFVRNPDYAGTTYCLDHTGKLLWTWNGHTEEYYGENYYDKNYYPVFHILHDFNKDGRAEILCMYQQHPWFPTKLIQFDQKGKVLNTFYNSGYLRTKLIKDFDGDGYDDIMFGGTNNGLRHAVLFVLKYPHFSGHSPQNNPNFIIRKEGANLNPPWLYMLFPKPSMFENVNRTSIKNIFHLDNDSYLILNRIHTNDSFVMYYLDPQFSIETLTVNERFVNTYRPDGYDDIWDYYDREMFFKQMSQIRYWNGKTWVDTFTVSER